MRKFVLFFCLAFPFITCAQRFTVYDTLTSEIPDNVIKTLNIDADGTLWFVTGDCFSGGSLVSYVNDTFTEYDTTSGIPDKFITCIAFDTNGVMWLGSRYHGISSFDGKFWTNYNPANSEFPDHYVKSLTVDKRNRVWAGTSNGLAVLYNNKWDVMKVANSALPDNSINSVACEKNSNAIWIATDKGILWAYDYGAIRERINPAPVIYNKSNSLLPDDQVNQVVLDDSNHVWISSWDGIVKVANGKWKAYTPSNSKLPSFVEYILTPHNGELWIATNMGLHIMKNDQWTTYTPSNSGLPDFFINRVAFDKDGNGWIATQSGLVKYMKH